MNDNFDKPSHYPALGYKVQPRVLDISRGMNFVSLKDQIIRGRWAVDALIGAGVLSTSKPKLEEGAYEFDLLIIGAGAAGVSAALCAEERHVRTLIIDRAGLALARQEHSKRLVSLSLYDWPAHHWDKSPWPHTEPVEYKPSLSGVSTFKLEGHVLGNISVRASVLTTQWRRQFDSLFPGGGKIANHLCFETYCGLNDTGRSIRYCYIRPDSVDVKLIYTQDHKTHPGQTFPVSVRIILFALGPGPERTSVGCYEGQPFWAYEARNKCKTGNKTKTCRTYYDCLEDDPINVAGKFKSNDIRLLISGGGDSSLQDFLRAVLLPRPYHDLKVVIEELKSASHGDRFEHLEREIFAAVWQTERARQLGGAGSDLDDALHQRIEKAVEDFIKPTPIMGKATFGGGTPFCTRIEGAIDKMLRKPVPKIRWLLNSQSVIFTGNYALNRFLCILLLKYFESHGQGKGIMVVPGKKLVKVRETGAGKLKARWGKAPVPPERAASSPWFTRIFDEVIIHHGQDPRPESQPVNWSLRPNFRYRGLRKVFERLAQPFKPIV